MLDETKLENVHRASKDGKPVILARCPACWEQGHDHTGEHLIIFEDKRFGCVLHQGQTQDGTKHRQRIAKLVGLKGSAAPVGSRTKPSTVVARPSLPTRVVSLSAPAPGTKTTPPKRPVDITTPPGSVLVVRVIEPKPGMVTWTLEWGGERERITSISSDQASLGTIVQRLADYCFVIADVRPLLACCRTLDLPFPTQWFDLRIMCRILENGLDDHPRERALATLFDNKAKVFDASAALRFKETMVKEIIAANLPGVLQLEQKLVEICDAMTTTGLLFDRNGLERIVQAKGMMPNGQSPTQSEIDNTSRLLSHLTPQSRIHPYWDPLGSETGRFTCTDTCIQNVNRTLRSFFIASPGYVFVKGDYAQADMRPIAAACRCPALIACLQPGRDFHREVASLINNKPAHLITPEERTVAKAIGLAIPLGKGIGEIAKDLERSDDEARDLMSMYFAKFPEIKKWRERILRYPLAEARSLGLKRRRILLAEDYRRANQTVNMVGQGTVADAIKIAMVALNDSLPPGSRLVASFHDELIIECPETEAPIVKALLQEAMELSLGKMIPGIPVVVNMSVSKTLE